MTRNEITAFNAGVEAVLRIARRSADIIRSSPWRPTKEGAADVLQELAEAGEALLIGPGPEPAPAALPGPATPPPAGDLALAVEAGP